MKRPPRNVASIRLLNAIKCQSHDVRNSGRSLRDEPSLSLILLLCCLVFLFYSGLGLGHGHGNEGNLILDNNRTAFHGILEDKFSQEANSHVANRSNNSTDLMLLQLNLSASSNNSSIDIDLGNHNQSLPVANGLAEVIWSILGYGDLVCEVDKSEELKPQTPKDIASGKPHHSTYINFDEFRNMTAREKVQTMPSRLVNITHRLEPDGKEYNYASDLKGAKVVAHNKEAKGACNILGKDQDKYLRNPCSVKEKFVVIELAEETLVDFVNIANFEHYSSTFKDVDLFGSLNYPTKNWTLLGKCSAANVKHMQSFKLPEAKWVRYLKLNLLSHYGSEFYCTLSSVEVYGVDAVERMLEDLFVSSEEPSPTKLLEINSTVGPPAKSELGPIDEKINVKTRTCPDDSDKGTENIVEIHQPQVDVTEKLVIPNKVSDPVTQVRQQPINRVHSDSVLKILMQKVKSLELNLSVLEEYIKELNRRQGEFLPELDKELSGISFLLEKSKAEIRDLKGWKEDMDKRFLDLQAWKAVVAYQLDLLVRENIMLRLDIEKVVKDRSNLESKELAVLLVSLFFVCFATIKLVSARVSTILGTRQSESESDKVCRTSRGWIMILVSSSMTIFITLLSS